MHRDRRLGIRHLGAVALTSALAFAVFSPTALALDEERYRKARTAIEKAIDYLESQQDEATGGWSVREGAPVFPAISAMALTGMLMEPDVDADDPVVSRGVDFLLSYRQDDGGIYDRVLPNYNTAISLSALALVNRPEAAAAIEPAQNYLRSIQWSEENIASADSPDSIDVRDRSHPYYGGTGYGGNGRPDNSNLSMTLQGLHDSGLSCDDEIFQRALVFLQRTQMHENVNDMKYAKGSRQGGFIYATGPNADAIGQGESKAGMIEETLDDGTRISRLRAYGSITYAGFKSYIYANLDRDDERVQLAYDWLRANYTVEENPGLGNQGLYYYYVTMSRALDAWGLATIETTNADGSTGASRDWANDLIDQLVSLQKPDGSFENVHDRWMEGDPVLVTAYALLALQHAIN